MKVKSIKFSDYIKINSTKEQLSYYQIIPHQNTRNYKSIEIANVINRCFKDIKHRINKLDEDFKLEYTQQTKVAYYIYFTQKQVEFYLILPAVYSNIFMEKLSLTWNRVEVKKINDIPRFSDNCNKVSMEYTKDDSLSIDLIDKKSCDLLEAQLNVINMLQEGDRVGIYYNFNYVKPYKQLGFKTNYNKAMDKVKEGKTLDKTKDSQSLGKFLVSLLVTTGEELMNGLSELLGEKRKQSSDMIAFNKTMGILQKKDLSKYSKTKGQLEVIDAQILLMSESCDKENEKLNINSLAQSFNVVDGDNTLRPKVIGVKRKIDLDKTKLPITSNKMSVEEVGMFISQPGKKLIQKYDIKANSINEEKVPDICKKGYISTGKVGKKQDKSYLNPNQDQDTGLAITGKQGSGKTEYVKNYSTDSNKHKDSIVILDYIGNNDLANSVQLAVPEEDIVLKDLSKVECMESIAYTEKILHR